MRTKREVNLKKYDAPHLQRIYNQGVRDGGNIAANSLQDYLDGRIESLTSIPGIGDKTIQKIIEHFKAGIPK